MGIWVNFTFFLSTLLVMQGREPSLISLTSISYLLCWLTPCWVYSLQNHHLHVTLSGQHFATQTESNCFHWENISIKIFLVKVRRSHLNHLSLVLYHQWSGIPSRIRTSPMIDFLCNNNWTKIRFPGEIHQNILVDGSWPFNWMMIAMLEIVEYCLTWFVLHGLVGVNKRHHKSVRQIECDPRQLGNIPQLLFNY